MTMKKRDFLPLILLMICIGMNAQITIIDVNETFQSDSIDRVRLLVCERQYQRETAPRPLERNLDVGNRTKSEQVL